MARESDEFGFRESRVDSATIGLKSTQEMTRPAATRIWRLGRLQAQQACSSISTRTLPPCLSTPLAIRCRDRNSYFATAARCACFVCRLTFAQRFRCAAAIASRASVLNARLAVLPVEVDFTAFVLVPPDEANARTRLSRAIAASRSLIRLPLLLRSLWRFPLIIVLLSAH